MDSPLVSSSAGGGTGSAGAGELGFLSPIDLAEKADIPLYPGAAVPNGKSNVRSGQTGTRYEIVMTTSDVAAKVLKFYSSKLSKAEPMPGGDNVMGLTPKHHFAAVTTKRTGSATEVRVVVTDEK